MTWWAYVRKHSGDEANVRIAEKIGVTPSSVGRWAKGSGPDPLQAASFARVYGRPVLEAFIAAGYLTPEEAGEQPSAPPTLASLSDEDLLAEVRRRLEGGTDAGNPDQKIVKRGSGASNSPASSTDDTAHPGNVRTFGAGGKRGRIVEEAQTVDEAARDDDPSERRP